MKSESEGYGDGSWCAGGGRKEADGEGEMKDDEG